MHRCSCKCFITCIFFAKERNKSKALQSCFSVLIALHCGVDVNDASLNARLSPIDSSSSQLTSQHQHQLQQQQQRHSTSTPTPSDDSATPISASGSVVSSPRDASVMDSGKSTMWLGTEDGWYVYVICLYSTSSRQLFKKLCRFTAISLLLTAPVICTLFHK